MQTVCSKGRPTTDSPLPVITFTNAFAGCTTNCPTPSNSCQTGGCGHTTTVNACMRAIHLPGWGQHMLPSPACQLCATRAMQCTAVTAFSLLDKCNHGGDACPSMGPRGLCTPRI